MSIKAMHRSGGGQRFLENKFNSRHPVMAVVRGDSCAWRWVRGRVLVWLRWMIVRSI
jgi:hypothetical protein